MAWRPLAILAGTLSLGRRCRGLYDAESRIESTRVFGNIHAYGYYFIDLVVGTPQQRVSVIIDTGSSICAFPCAGCEHCGHHVDPAFDLARSSSARWLQCGGACRGGCDRGYCSYVQGYSEGSSISGTWFEDAVQLGDSIQRNPAIRTRLGCHHQETNLFYSQKANGILGIGPRRNSLLRDLFADGAHVQGSVFALCLAEWGGRLVVGGHNDSYHTGPMQYIPLNVDRGTYGVSLTSLRLEGMVLSSQLGYAMVDSGTTYTYMASRHYRALRDAIASHCLSGRCGRAQRLADGGCWLLPGGREDLERFPRVEMTFGDATVRWTPSGYLYSKDPNNTWCFAFMDDGPAADTTLGASWMLHNEVVFDLQAGRLGVAPAACPEYRERPQHTPKKSDSDMQTPVESLGAVRMLHRWELAPLALLAFLPLGCVARQCMRWRPIAHARLALGTAEEPSDASTPWM